MRIDPFHFLPPRGDEKSILTRYISPTLPSTTAKRATALLYDLANEEPMKNINFLLRFSTRLSASLSFILLASAASAATLTTLYSFQNGGTDANGPSAGLIKDGAGNLYGPSYGGGSSGGGSGTIFELSPPPSGQTAWIETVIHAFSAVGGQNDGVHPEGRLLIDAGGNLYGTTNAGGGSDNDGGGTVFQLVPPTTAGNPWTLNTLYVFPVNKVGLGHRPYTALLMDTTGALYGTTPSEGAVNVRDVVPGLVYKLSPPATGQTSWTYTTLYSFPVSKHNVDSPTSGLVADTQGNLYATFAHYGTKANFGIFELSPPAEEGGDWIETTIFTFPDSSGSPVGELVMDESGALYGATDASGGSIDGTVYRLTPPGAGQTNWTQTILGKFKNAHSTASPNGGVVFGAQGQLYGNTLGGEGKSAAGTTYQLTPPASGSALWTNQTLIQFKSKPAGGGLDPIGSLILDTVGNLYGVTEVGGTDDVGTVFEITP
jgi:hypothetical protein